MTPRNKAPALVRVSDLGTWTFCQRAWWLARIKGAEHRQPRRLRQGEAIHHAHGTTVQRAQQVQWLGLILLGLALCLIGLMALWFFVV